MTNELVQKSRDEIADSEEIEISTDSSEPGNFVERTRMYGISMDVGNAWLKGATTVRIRRSVEEDEDFDEILEDVDERVIYAAQQDFQKLIKSLKGNKK